MTTPSMPCRPPVARLLASLALALVALHAPAVAQSAEPPVPAVGTSGTLLSVAIEGLGDKPPKVWLTRDDTKKRTKLKVIEASPTSLTLLLKKAPPAGLYDLTLKPTGGDEFELDEAFEVALPQGLEAWSPSALPGGVLTLDGFFLGDRKGQVRVGGQKAKVVEWQALAGVDDLDVAEVPPGRIVALVPKKLPDGQYPIEVTNDAGGALTGVALTIGGSDVAPKGKKPRLTAQIGDALVDTKLVNHVLGAEEIEVFATFPSGALDQGHLTLRLLLDTAADPPASLTQANWQAFVRYKPHHPGTDGCPTCPVYASTSCTVSGLELDGKLLRAQFQAELEDTVGGGPPLTLQAGHVTSKLVDGLPPPVTMPSIVSFTASDETPAVGEAVVFSWELADVDPQLTSWTLEVPLGSGQVADPVSGVAAYTPLNAVDLSARLRLFQAGVQIESATVGVSPQGLLVIIEEPWENKVFDEVLPVRARVGNALFELTEVLATVGGVQVPLVAQGGDFVGDVPLASLTPGMQELVVSAADLDGQLSQASRAFDYDIKPVLTITSPTAWSVGTPELHVVASGSDADGGPLSLSALIKPEHTASQLLATGGETLDAVLDLSPWAGQDLFLQVRIGDGTWLLTQSVEVLAEDSEALVSLGTVPGELMDLDADGTRATLVDELAEPPTYALLDLATWTVEPIPVPDGLEISSYLGFLGSSLSCRATATGAVYFARLEDGPSGRVLVDWNLGRLLVVSQAAQGLHVAGDYATFLGQPGEGGEINRWRFSTTTLVNQITDGNLDHAVNELGDVFWQATSFEPWRVWLKKKGEVAHPISLDGDQWHGGVVADGPRCLYARKTGPSNASGQLVLYDGDAEVQVREYQPFSVVGVDYRLAGEWVAFNRAGTSGQRQAWVRDPAGVETKVSSFADDSWLEVLADDGTLMFTVDDRRYLWRGSGMPDDVGHAQGRPLHRGGQWYVLLGNTLFHVP